MGESGAEQAVSLLSITYLSSATTQLSRTELLSTVASAQPRNAVRGVTGILLYSGGNILQTIEGPTSAVQDLYDLIVADPRHCDVTMVLRTVIAARTFPQWTMGFRDVKDEAPGEAQSDRPSIPSNSGSRDSVTGSSDHIGGLNDFFQRAPAKPPSSLGGRDADPVRLLAEIFRRSTR